MTNSFNEVFKISPTVIEEHVEGNLFMDAAQAVVEQMQEVDTTDDIEVVVYVFNLHPPEEVNAKENYIGNQPFPQSTNIRHLLLTFPFFFLNFFLIILHPDDRRY